MLVEFYYHHLVPFKIINQLQTCNFNYQMHIWTMRFSFTQLIDLVEN